MASSIRSCAVKKCEISSCAVCHCCQKDLCLDHLKEHKDQLNAKLLPLANQLNTFLDGLQQFDPTSLPSFQILEQWRIDAHRTVDQFYERMQLELFEEKKNKPLEELHMTREKLDQLIRKQGATRENIDLLLNDVRSIEQQINNLQNIQINLRPLVVDDNIIIQASASNKTQKRIENNQVSNNRNDLTPLDYGDHFQIFVKMPSGKTYIISIEPTDAILEVKRKIQEKDGIPVDQQQLTHMGKLLKDDFPISTYGIQRHTTINLIHRLKNK